MRALAERLRADGLRVWFDERSVGKDKLEFAEVRWMEISSVLQRESQNGAKPVKQIEFKGERLDMTSVCRWRDKE